MNLANWFPISAEGFVYNVHIVNTLKLALMDLIIHSRVPTVLMVNQGSAKGLRFRVTNIFGKFANQLSPTRGATGKFYEGGPQVLIIGRMR